MHGILRAEGGWTESIADALRRAPRPIPYDERLLPRMPDGTVRRRDPPTGRGVGEPRRAATLLALYPDDAGELVIPLTVRRHDLRAHAGEVSLPGGALDDEDADHAGAALREAWEEIGLDPDLVRVAGTLDDVWIPVSNYRLRPVVGTVDRRPTLVPHDAEVASIVELPLAVLFDPERITSEEFRGASWIVRTGAYRHGDIVVWGATALTLGMLAHVLREA
jgi:8-oxo-dGTP pyrophosphatase MutT (NUDIX family)